MSLKLLSALILATLLVTSSQHLFADQKKQTPEAVAIAFAEQHHPELASLLGHLKEMDQKRYDNAISDLNRTSERLSKSKERDSSRYETELKLWKLDSRVRLLAARSASGMEDSVREQIRTLLLERNAVRLAQMKADQAKLDARLTKMNDAIEALETSSEELAERDLDRLVKSVKSRASQNKRTPKPKAKSPKTSK